MHSPVWRLVDGTPAAGDLEQALLAPHIDWPLNDRVNTDTTESSMATMQTGSVLQIPQDDDLRTSAGRFPMASFVDIVARRLNPSP